MPDRSAGGHQQEPISSSDPPRFGQGPLAGRRGARVRPFLNRNVERLRLSEWEARCGFGRSAHVPGRSAGGHQQEPFSSSDLAKVEQWGEGCGCVRPLLKLKVERWRASGKPYVGL